MFETIQRLIDQEARLRIPASDLTPRADLYELGLTAYTAIRLLLAIEREFDIEFPRRLLNKETMASIESICRSVRLVQGEIPAPAREAFRAAA